MSTAHPFSTTTTPPPPPQQQQQQHVYPNLRPSTTPIANPSQGILYPVASSGRGFISKPNVPSDQTVTVANHAGYPPRPNHLLPRPHLDAYHHHHHVIRPHLNQQQHLYLNPQVPPPIRGIPVSSAQPKVAPCTSSISYSNGCKNSRDKRDETIAILRERKVRIANGASLYALCRSWLRNGVPEESQPQFGDGLKSLPRPLPMPMEDTNEAKKREHEEEEDDDDKEDVDNLSPQDLLKRHVKHAKRVRTRLREERAKRIDRYKTRLSLLLPPLVEQSRNDAPAGN